MALKVAFIFPGQGAQEIGMGKSFYDKSEEARAVFMMAEARVPGLTNTIFYGTPEKLTSTKFCQPAIVTASIAALSAFQAHPKYKNIEPCFSAGLSLGEYSALVACEALNFGDAIGLIERRAAFMEEATKLTAGSMAAVIGFDAVELQKVCDDTGAQVANFNSLDQIVITGEKDKVEKTVQVLQERGAKRVIPLEVSGGFHSRLMLPAAEKLKPELQNTNIQNAIYPLIGNVDAKPVTDAGIIRDNLALQITSSVRWVETIQYIASQGVTTFIEIGPGSVLKGLVRKIDRNLTVHNIQTTEDLESFSL